MGGDASDWFVESRFYLDPAAFVGVSLERVKYDGGDRSGERRTIASVGLTGWLTKSWRGEARAAVDRVTAEGGVPGRDGSAFSAWVALSWQTDRLIPADEEEVPIREYQGVGP